MENTLVSRNFRRSVLFETSVGRVQPAVQATKESVLRCLALDMDEAYKLEAEISSKVFQTEDAKEGPKAFAEKRPPVWQGR